MGQLQQRCRSVATHQNNTSFIIQQEQNSSLKQRIKLRIEHKKNQPQTNIFSSLCDHNNEGQMYQSVTKIKQSKMHITSSKMHIVSSKKESEVLKEQQQGLWSHKRNSSEKKSQQSTNNKVNPQSIEVIKLNSNILQERQYLAKCFLKRLNISMEGEEEQSKGQLVILLINIIFDLFRFQQDHLIEKINQMFCKQQNLHPPNKTCLQKNSITRDLSYNQRVISHELELLLRDIKSSHLDILDMICHHQNNSTENTTKNNLYAAQLSLNNIIDLKKVIISHSENSKYLSPTKEDTYETLKSKGLALIKQKKVYFIILAGGNNWRFHKSYGSRKQEEEEIQKLKAKQGQKQQASLEMRKNISGFDQFEEALMEEQSHMHYYNDNQTHDNQTHQNTTIKELTPLSIPSQKSILEIIITRLHALSQLLQSQIEGTIICESSKEKIIKAYLSENQKPKLKFNVIPQNQIGGLDAKGKLVVTDSGNVSLWSNGTGDVWDYLSVDDGNGTNIDYLKEKGFEFLQIFGTSNTLEKCFDCYMLGLTDEEDLDWSTKIVDCFSSKKYLKSYEKNGTFRESGVEAKIFTNKNNEIYVCDPQEVEYYPKECGYTFTNHSIFKVEYLGEAFKNESWFKERSLRKKVHRVNNCEPLSQYAKVVTYEKDFTDIFTCSSYLAHSPKPISTHSPKPISTHSPNNTQENQRNSFKQQAVTQPSLQPVSESTRFKLIKCERQSEYYPYIYHTYHHSDIEHASIALSDLHKSYLNIENRYPLEICEIDANVSLEGENLETIIEDLRKQKQINREHIEALFITLD